MTVKLVVLYTQPDDPAAFDEHYLGVHMPLVAKIPGLQRAETATFVAVLDGGDKPFYRSAELYFPDEATMQAGFGSAEGRATAKDYSQIAPPGSRMLVATVDD